MSIFGKKNKNGDRSVNLKYIDGVEAYSNGTAVALSIDNTNECITMIARVYKKPPVHLKFEQVTGVRVVSEKEIIEKVKVLLVELLLVKYYLGHWELLLEEYLV
ncbi:hypothetical protein [Clostridium beijerinckii]|uniref:hypothetical protein n=1 Tax=Clostridium beijerinckii TaxID=1520 RepID=UPI001F4C18FE|nr:hypothetical protein [Clostridium beijerinckii]NOW02431.1 hypothetical protein [Clostridium beijerinckii]